MGEETEHRHIIRELRESHNACQVRVQAHMSRHETLWEGMKDWRRQVDERDSAMAKRMAALEKKIAYYAGGAAVIGALAGKIIVELFKHLNGV